MRPVSEISLDDDLGKIDFLKKFKAVGKAVAKATPKIDFIGGAKKIIQSPAVMNILSKAVSFIPGVGPMISTGLDASAKLLSKNPELKNINVAKAVQELKTTGANNVATGKVFPLSPEASKVAVALKQVEAMNPNISAEKIVAGAVEDVKKGLPIEKVEQEIQKDVQAQKEQQAIQIYRQTTGETPTPEEIQEYKQENPDAIKQYSLFSDLSKDAITPEENLKQARAGTRSYFEKTLKYMNDTNNVIQDRVKKADKDLWLRLSGIMNGVYTDLRQAYATAYGSDVPLLYRMKQAVLNADVKKPVTIMVKSESTSAKIPIDQAIAINVMVQKNIESIYNRIGEVSKQVDSFFIQGTKPGQVPLTIQGKTTNTPTYQAPVSVIEKLTGSKPGQVPAWIVPATILATAGVGAYMIMKTKKK